MRRSFSQSAMLKGTFGATVQVSRTSLPSAIGASALRTNWAKSTKSTGSGKSSSFLAACLEMTRMLFTMFSKRVAFDSISPTASRVLGARLSSAFRMRA